jgi:hypothetical protein
MQFNNFLGAYYRDTGYGGDRLYADMLAQAKLVDRLGFRGVTIPRAPPDQHTFDSGSSPVCGQGRVDNRTSGDRHVGLN